MNADLQNIVDQLNAERYAGTWWTRRANEQTPQAVGPSLPELTADELETRRGHIRRRELENALNEPARGATA